MKGKYTKHKLNLYPEIKGDEYDNLKLSISSGFDKTFPIVIYHGAVLDGWNRYRACQDTETEPTIKEFSGSDNDALMFVIRSNERRYLDASKRACMAVEYEPIFAAMAKERQGQRNDLKAKNNIVENFPQCIDDNKARKQAAKMLGVNEHYVTDAKRIKEEAPELYDRIINDVDYGIQDAKKEIKDRKKEERTENEREGRKKEVQDIDIRIGDFKDVLSDVYDIKAIITDPPYPQEYIECFSDLGKFASEHLTEKGFCVVYSGQFHLPEVIRRLSEHLTYMWTFCLSHNGKTQLVNGINVMCGWKPILVFSRGVKKLPFTGYDVVVSEQMEKHSHEWQQSESGVEKLIELFSLPGELIVDPFSGSGTFCKVAKALGRIAIGAEINDKA